MSAIIKAVEFLHNNWGFIKENWYIFLMWTLILISVIIVVVKIINKKRRKELRKTKSDLVKSNIERDQQKEHYKNLEAEAWAASPRVKPPGYSAKSVSDAIQEKYNPKNK